MLRWVRRHEPVWTHVHLTGIAVRIGGDWIAIWTRVALADSPPGRSLLGKSVVRSDGVLAFRVGAPVGELRTILSEIGRGEITARRLGRSVGSVRTWCPPGASPTGLSFSDYVNSAYMGSKTEGPDGWPRVELDLRGGALAQWAGEKTERFEYLAGVERRFKALRFGSIGELASRLGFRYASSDFIYAQSQSSFAAPLPARLVSAEHDRTRNVIAVVLEVGPRVSRSRMGVGLAQVDGRPPPPEIQVPDSKTRFVRIKIPNPSEGAAEIFLTYRDLGVIGSLKVEVKPGRKPWPRCAVLSLIDPGFKQIREDLASTKPELHERGTALLLETLGYAAVWWTRGLPQPKGSRSGKHAQDIVAFSGHNSECLVVECKTDWLSEAKINTLVGRANAVAHVLERESTADAVRTRALLVVARPRHETPRAVTDAVRRNRAGLMALDDATDLLEMVEQRLPLKVVRDRFEGLFEPGGVMVWDAEWS
jgi:Holliday junction resolvase